MTPRSKNAGRVRIIAGRWRGSRLDVPNVAGLRPSSDRVRETLFNWLQGDIAGACCLDLFAGSGALGLEAASRGAARVTMIERDPAALVALEASKARLRGEHVDVVAADALEWLARVPDRTFDVVFVDPPFAAGLHQKALDALGPWLAPGAQVYVETTRDAAMPILSGFAPHREGVTRDVRFALLRRCGGDAPATLVLPPGAD